VARDLGGKIKSDYYLRLLIIENNEKNIKKINSITFRNYSGERLVSQISYAGEILKERMKSSIELITSLRENTIRGILGLEKFWSHDRLSNTLELKEDELFILSEEHFSITYNDYISKVEIVVEYSKDNEIRYLNDSINVLKYENKTNYIFPVKGSWVATDSYASIDSHRWNYNSEFAFDLGKLSSDTRLIYKDSMENEDYIHYGDEIIAIGDGEVVDCLDGFPEYSLGYKNKMSREHFDELEKLYGSVARSSGNYVTIKHEGEEYSFYCHMKPGTVNVKKGQKVKAGDAIGNIGSTGNSNCPHLHFHLMDGPSKDSRGLPCYFNNIKNFVNQEINFIEEETTLVIAK